MTEVEVPKQHKACVYDNPGHVSVKVETVGTPGFGAQYCADDVQVDTPEPGPGK